MLMIRSYWVNISNHPIKITQYLNFPVRGGNLCTYQCQSQGGGGGGSGNPQEFDYDVYPQGGDFDHFDRSITKSRREINQTFDRPFLPGGGDFDIFFRKCQNPHLCPTRPIPIVLGNF